MRLFLPLLPSCSFLSSPLFWLFCPTVKLFNSQYLFWSVGPHFCCVLLCFVFLFLLFLDSCCSCKTRLPLCHFCANLISYHLASFPAQEESFGVQNSYFLFSVHALPPVRMSAVSFGFCELHALLVSVCWEINRYQSDNWCGICQESWHLLSALHRGPLA